MLEGGEPEARPHFTLGYHDHVFTRDEEYAMMSRNDGTEARLYDLKKTPACTRTSREIFPTSPAYVRRLRPGRRRGTAPRY